MKGWGLPQNSSCKGGGAKKASHGKYDFKLLGPHKTKHQIPGFAWRGCLDKNWEGGGGGSMLPTPETTKTHAKKKTKQREGSKERRDSKRFTPATDGVP